MEKFYIPATEDLRVGYECLIKEPNREDLVKKKIGVSDISDLIHRKVLYGGVYTEYLTQEQIEDLGWVYRNKGYYLNFEHKNPFETRVQDFYQYKCYNLYLQYSLEDHVLKIKGDFVSSGMDDADVLFEGYCPSVNELVLILKLLNISNENQ